MTTTSLEYAGNNSSYFLLLKHIFNPGDPYNDLVANNTAVTGSALDSEIAYNKEKNDINKSELLRLFNQQNKKYSHYINSKDAFSTINKAIGLVGALNYEKSALEITPDNSLFFNLKYADGVNIHIEFFMNPHGGNNKEAFFSIYEGDIIHSEGFGEIKTVIMNIESYFQKKIIMVE